MNPQPTPLDTSHWSTGQPLPKLTPTFIPGQPGMPEHTPEPTHPNNSCTSSRHPFSAFPTLAMRLAEIPKQLTTCGGGRDHIPKMLHKTANIVTIGNMEHLSALLIAAHMFTLKRLKIDH